VTRAVWKKTPQLERSGENKTVYRLDLQEMRRSKLSGRKQKQKQKTGNRSHHSRNC